VIVSARGHALRGECSEAWGLRPRLDGWLARPERGSRRESRPHDDASHTSCGVRAELYREEQASGTLAPKADADVLAFAVVRVTEGFIYNDALATVEPAVDRAAEIVALLLE
jgi:tetracycline repressor-like protein